MLVVGVVGRLVGVVRYPVGALCLFHHFFMTFLELFIKNS